jgi:hypothetical protein
MLNGKNAMKALLLYRVALLDFTSMADLDTWLSG